MSDMIEYYFYFTSLDDKTISEECPLAKDCIRTHIYFGMHKFEVVPESPDSEEYCV